MSDLSPVISQQQFGLLKSLKEGDIVSFRHPGNKNFGPRQRVTGISNLSEYEVKVHHVPLKDTRKPGSTTRSGGRGMGRVGEKGMEKTVHFYPYNAEYNKQHGVSEIRKH